MFDADCGAWERSCIYQPWLVEHEGRFYDFYNAAQGGREQTGLALSTDLLSWKRYPGSPVVRLRPDGYDANFASDPKVFRDGDHWVMFYFGVGPGGAHVMAAFSRDLLHWTAHPDPLYKAGGHPGGLDKQYAHKISLVYNPKNETFYMYYCATGNKGRCIGLITSKPLDKGPKQSRIVSQYKTVMEHPPGRVPSRDIVDGPLLGNGDLGAVISGNPEAQRFWISKNNFWRLKDGHRQGGPRLFGGLEIDIPALVGGTYHVEQDIYPAITTARFAKGPSTVTIRSCIAATAPVLLVELSASGGPVDVEAKLWAAPGRGSTEELGRKDAMPWARKAFFNKPEWVNQTRPTSAACAMTLLGAAAPAFKLQAGQKVTLAVAMQSSLDAKDPLASALKMAAELNAEGVAQLLEEHARWWREFWAKSLVEIGDPLLEKAYYMANYELGSALRDPEFPTGLFGLWVTSDDPRWAGDYHLNFDYQSQFYSLYKSNHIEQADTFEQPVLAFMERGKAYAKKELNVRGVYYPVGIGAKGIQTSSPRAFLGQKCNAPYCLVNMAMRWYHTYDLDYAKKVYPFVVEVANFWEDYLKFENGRYVVYNDSIQENSGPDFNSALSLGLVYNTFTLALDMSSELGVDKERQEKWRHILKHLSKFPTFQKDGATVFRYSEKGTAWIDGNSVGLQHIYPCGAIGLDDDPKLLEIARNSIAARGRPWANDNGENSHYPAAVRVAFDPATILDKLRILCSTSRKMPNGLPEDPEQCSTVPNTINEMLCMSHRQVLRVFPVWPKNKDARFWSLRAEGAFLVSSGLEGGKVQYVKISSERGRDCTLVNPWPAAAVAVYRDGKKVETLKGGRIVIKTKTGTTVVLGPDGEAYPAAAG